MSLDLLGDGFDIHGGGQDLAFPHHENERAQAVADGPHVRPPLGAQRLRRGRRREDVEVARQLHEPARPHRREPTRGPTGCSCCGRTTGRRSRSRRRPSPTPRQALERLDAFARRVRRPAADGATRRRRARRSSASCMDDDLDTPARDGAAVRPRARGPTTPTTTTAAGARPRRVRRDLRRRRPRAASRGRRGRRRRARRSPAERDEARGREGLRPRRRAPRRARRPMGYVVEDTADRHRAPPPLIDRRADRPADGRPSHGMGSAAVRGRGRRAERRPLPPGFGIIWTTVAVDLIGFGIVLPILPLYAERLRRVADDDRPARGVVLARPAAVRAGAGAACPTASAASRCIICRCSARPSAACSPALAGLAVAAVPRPHHRRRVGRERVGRAGRGGRRRRAGASGPACSGLLGAAFGVGFVAGPAIGALAALGGTALPFFIAAAIAARQRARRRSGACPRRTRPRVAVDRVRGVDASAERALDGRATAERARRADDLVDALAARPTLRVPLRRVQRLRGDVLAARPRRRFDLSESCDLRRCSP